MNILKSIWHSIATRFIPQKLAVSLRKKTITNIDNISIQIKKSNTFDDNLIIIQKMLNINDFDRVGNLYKKLLEEDASKFDEIIEKDIEEFSNKKANNVIRDYLNAIRGVLLNHIISNINKDMNHKFSEIRRNLENKISKL